MKFVVVYQDTPFAFTTPGTLVIEADNKAEAVATAAKVLLERGHVINHMSVDHATNGLTADEIKQIEPRLPQNSIGGGTRIRSIEEHMLPVMGKVLQG